MTLTNPLSSLKNVFSISFIMLMLSFSALAQTYTFTGSGNWETASNWDVYPGTMPPPVTSVIINGDCTIESGTSVDLIGVSLTVNANKSLTIEGTVTITNGSPFTANGDVTIANTGIIDRATASNNYLVFHGNFLNNGTILAKDRIYFKSTCTGTNNGIITNKNDGNRFYFENTTAFVNNGTIDESTVGLNRNNIRFLGPVENNGSITAFGYNLYSSTHISGTGSIGGASGHGYSMPSASGMQISPGTSPGIVTFTNLNHTMNAGAILNIEVDGTAGAGASGGHDQLNLGSGTFTAAGTLNLTFNYTPANGATFQIVNASNYAGSFTNINITPGSITATYTNGVVTVTGGGGSSCADSDGDGHDDIACGGDDCDDGNASINPGATEICDGIDNDCDGDVDEGFDADGDGYTSCGGDCNDNDASINPSAAEVCDGIDNNCDGQVDEGVTSTFYADTDSDGYGDANTTTKACSAPSGYVTNDADCDDVDATVYPGAPELCDGIDNDCDGVVPGDETDDDGDGMSECEGDCDDTDATVFPGAPELCDGIDNDCDGVVPNDEIDTDGDGELNCIDTDDDGDGFEDACDSEPLIDNYTYTGYEDLPESWKCGNNKVYICHGSNNPHTNCVNKNAVQAHLNHGDYLGPCTSCGGQNMISNPNNGSVINSDHSEAVELEIFPNPAKNMVNIHVHDSDSEVLVNLYDQLGRVVWSQKLDAGQIATSINLDEGRFGNGIYLVSTIINGERITQRLVIAK